MHLKSVQFEPGGIWMLKASATTAPDFNPGVNCTSRLRPEGTHERFGRPFRTQFIGGIIYPGLKSRAVIDDAPSIFWESHGAVIDDAFSICLGSPDATGTLKEEIPGAKYLPPLARSIKQGLIDDQTLLDRNGGPATHN